MPEHFSKSTVQATVWCAKCNGFTPHMIADGRRGGCLACIEKREPAEPVQPAAAVQEEMFR